MQKLPHFWPPAPSYWALLAALVWALGSSLTAQEAPPTPSSEPTATPTSGQTNSTSETSDALKTILLQLRSQLVEQKAQAGTLSLGLTSTGQESSAAMQLSSTQSAATQTALETSATASAATSTSLTDASASSAALETDHQNEQTAVETILADYEGRIKAARCEAAWWRVGALAAAGGLAGALWGLKSAAIGAGVGAVAGGVWWIINH